MHIERILLRDVGPFKDVTIDLTRGTDPNLADVYLLTGSNGTGKSTILHALASVIGTPCMNPMNPRHGVEFGRDLLAARMRSKTALVAFRTGDGQIYAVTLPEYDPVHDLRKSLGECELGTARNEALVHWHTGYPPYALAAARFRAGDPPDRRSALGWAAFAYAGVRSVSDVEITAVQEPKQSPFENSLSFVETADTGQLANWIVNQNYQRLKAKEAGHHERAAQLAKSVRDIEMVVAKIVDDPDFGFVITDEDNNVRIRWKGTVVRLGLLPDGLRHCCGPMISTSASSATSSIVSIPASYSRRRQRAQRSNGVLAGRSRSST